MEGLGQRGADPAGTDDADTAPRASGLDVWHGHALSVRHPAVYGLGESCSPRAARMYCPGVMPYVRRKALVIAL